MSDFARAEALHLRLFIEGVEVEVIGASVTASEGAPAQAQIELVPANSGLLLSPRSKVLLFFLDGGSDLLSTVENPADGTRGIPDEHYNLLFSGELVSIGYSKSGAGGRSLVMQCLDDSNIWDTSYLFTLRYSAGAQEGGATAGRVDQFLAMNESTNPIDDVLNDVDQVIRTTASRQHAFSTSVAESSGMLGGLLGILELIGGVPGKFVGMTAWHTVEEARLRVMDQIAADSGATAKDLFDATAFDEWLTKGVGDMGTVISFRQIIDHICGYIYYSVAPNPVGVYIDGERDPPEWPDGLIDYLIAKSGQSLIADGSSDLETSETLGNFDPEFLPYTSQLLKALQSDPYNWNGTNGKAAARMSSGTRTAAQQKALMAGTKRANQAPFSPHMYGYAMDISLAGHGVSFVYKNKPNASGTLHQRLIYWAAKVSTPDELYAATDAKGAAVFTATEIADAKQMILFYKDLRDVVKSVGGGKLLWGGDYTGEDSADDWCKLHGLGGDCVHAELLGWRDKLKARRKAELSGTSGVSADPAPSIAAGDLDAFYKTLPKRERLLTQFFRPDIWFAAPPACNIIFPEEVQTLNFNRDPLRETTRLQLSTFSSTIGDDVIVNSTYYAPKLEKEQSLASAGLGTAQKAFIYPHEKFSGIVPKMERMSDLPFYARMSSDQKVATESGASTGAAGEDADNQLEQWAERTAAFTFLSYRYSARQLSLSMKFTPRLVLGYPALVIDRVNPESLGVEDVETSPFRPNHFLGMIRTVTHTLNQSGGNTSVSLSHVRLHRADMDDLFASSVYENGGVLSVQVIPSGTEPVTLTHIAAVSPRMLLWLESVSIRMQQDGADQLDLSAPDITGPNGNPLVGAITVVQEDETDEDVLANDETWMRGGAAPKKKFEWVDIDAIDGAPGVDLVFSSITFTEETGGTPAYLPLEEAIRPPWMSDEYSNSKIGELYQKHLGCGSLVDMYDGVEPRTVNGVKMSSAGIEDLTEALVSEYTAMSDGGFLNAGYIREKTDRLFASLPDVLHGFYSQTSGPYSNLEGSLFEWMRGGDASVAAPATQINPSEENKVDARLDARKERRQRALAYATELMRSRGLRG